MAKLSIVFDFDGTLATSFIGGLMFRGYTPEDKVAAARERYVSGTTTLREYQEEVFDLASESPSEMSRRAVAGTTIRSGAQEICRTVWDAGGEVAVASAGLDFYIQPVLDNAGLGRIDVHSGEVVSDPTEHPPFRYDYPSADADCNGDWVTCKCKVINDLKSGETDNEVIFVGDGTGADPCAATNAADTVFASGRLLTYCSENEVPAKEFGSDLGPVLAYVRSMTLANGVQ